MGDTEPRKNLAGLLAAYARYRAGAGDPAPLVLAGAAAAAAGEPGVTGAPDPSPAELAALLDGARALVHPSLHEGFGLPLVEAMALGVPVVAVASAGRARGLRRRRAAGGARRAGGRASGAWPATPACAADLAERGCERAGRFTWEASARAHVRAYTLALRP